MRTPGQIRITLVSIHPTRSPQSVPLAPAFLAASLKNTPGLTEKIAVTIIELYKEQTPQESANALLATEPDMVGFSIYTWNRHLSVSTAKLLYLAAPDIMLFCGGPEATADQLRMLQEAPWKFLVHGEGEATLSEVVKLLLKGERVEGVPGTAVLENGCMKSCPPQSLINLENLPSPLLTKEIDPLKYSGMLWQLSRGCSFGCDFCFDGGGSRTVRHFPLERIKEELEWFVGNEISQVFVLDSTFNSDRERAVKILKLIKKIAPHIHFHFEVRSEFIDKQQAMLFASITCSLQIGLQSSDPLVLKNSGRSFVKSDFVSKIALLNNSGAVFGFDLIYGLPGDSLTGFRNSVDFAIGLYPNHLDIFPLALLPGTRLAARSRELELIHQEAAPYLVTSSPSFPKEDMALAANLAAACDIFYSRGKAVSWFMSMLHLLKIKPSLFFEAFYGFAGEEIIISEPSDRFNDAKILELQCGFITLLFTEKKQKKFLPVALDIILYNYHYAAALMAAPPELPGKRQLAGITLARRHLKLAESALLARFNYEILDILESGIADLRELASLFSTSGSTAVIYPKNGEVLTESLSEAYFKLLENLNTDKQAGEIATELGIPPREAESFLKLALLEGIIVLDL